MGHFFLYHTPYCSPHTAPQSARLPNTATSASPLSASKHTQHTNT